MTFSPPRSIPTLKADAQRVLLASLTAIGIDLRQALSGGLQVTPVQTADGLASFGQLILCAPPAGNMRALLPKGTLTNKSGRVLIGVLSVGSGGAVVVSVTGGEQTINGASTVTLSSVGLFEFMCCGANGWLQLGGGGGGGGLTPIADETFLANVSGAPAVPVAVNLSSLAGTGLVWNAGTNALDASGGGTDPRIFAWWGV